MILGNSSILGARAPRFFMQFIEARRVLKILKSNKVAGYGARMHFAREDCQHELLVRSFENGQIRVGESLFERSLILSNRGLIDNWRPQQFDELQKDDFNTVAELETEIVLIGTGQSLRFPAPGLTAQLLMAGTGVEVMDTAAACRTFNILLSEGRSVAAALLLR